MQVRIAQRNAHLLVFPDPSPKPMAWLRPAVWSCPHPGDTHITVLPGALTTFWNVYTVTGDGMTGRRKSGLVRTDFGPWLNFVGKTSQFPTSLNATFAWTFENVDFFLGQSPGNIYEAQKALRLSSPGRVSPLLGGMGSGGVLLSNML
jgi:hypothetical protein